MPPRPNIGELRHRIRVARRTRAPDPDFGFQEVMTLVAEIWADVTHANAGVNYLDDATNAEAPGVTHVFTVRRDRRGGPPGGGGPPRPWGGGGEGGGGGGGGGTGRALLAGFAGGGGGPPQPPPPRRG